MDEDPQECEVRALRALVSGQQYHIAYLTKVIQENQKKCSSCNSLTNTYCRDCGRKHFRPTNIPSFGPGGLKH